MTGDLCHFCKIKSSYKVYILPLLESSSPFYWIRFDSQNTQQAFNLSVVTQVPCSSFNIILVYMKHKFTETQKQEVIELSWGELTSSDIRNCRTPHSVTDGGMKPHPRYTTSSSYNCSFLTKGTVSGKAATMNIFLQTHRIAFFDIVHKVSVILVT